jgi:hypothetical protein
MSSLVPINVYGYDKGGLVKYNKPLLLEDDAFQNLENAYVFRGTLQKRFGSQLIGRLRRNFTDINYFPATATSWTFNIKSVVGYVSNANNANPGQITTTAPHGLVNGDLVILSNVGGATGYNNVTFTITVVDNYNFTVGVNAAAFGAYTSGGFFISNRSLTASEPNAQIIPGTFRVTFDGKTFIDQGNGLLALSPSSANNYGFINYSSGAVGIVNDSIGGPFAAVMTYSYAPGLPVMGIKQREIANINDEQTIFFDTKYAYIYVGAVFTEFLPGTKWDSLNYKFFWTENYTGSTSAIRLFFETNFINDVNNPMRYTNGATWTDFAPVLYITGGNSFAMYSARILVSYYGRLLAFNTYEGQVTSPTTPQNATNFFNRCRFSQIGDPTSADAWRSDIFGKGGFIDAPTNEEIISVAYIKNTLIVYFEQTTWQLRYVGEYGLPFIWERISSDFGAESTFSPVLFNDQVLSVGDKAVTAANATDVQRIDLAIPDFVFNEIQNKNQGPERVYGIRDYQKELVYWAYPLETDQRVFQSNVLVYNYRNNTYSIFRDNVTCFGTFQLQNPITWDSLSTYWDNDNVFWNDQNAQTQFPAVVSGNAQGYIHNYNSITPDEPSLHVENIVFGATTRITSTNHNLDSGDIIQLKGLTFVDTTVAPYALVATTINDKTYYVQYVNQNQFDIYIWTGTNYSQTITAPVAPYTYTGTGTISLLPKMLIQTKDFSPFIKQGLQTKASYFDFLLDVPEGPTNDLVAFSIAINVNSSPAAVANIIVGNKQLETTTPQQFYVPASQYAWHRFFATLNGQFFNMTFTYDDELMNKMITHENTWALNAITLYARTGGRNTF